ncbi:FUSC family protein [Hanstruepera ponticola]|uniref:FUSC family protein n=1 Tax=Hanstruepera ponticola TaxID=2042995 RepID=UPI0017876258|nr:FUSC family protein [Hanstruepera ponticola]
MRKLCVILALIAAILAVILSVLPVSNFAFIPAIASLIFGLVAMYLSNKQEKPKHTIKLAFLLTILALGLATYKSIYSTSEVGDTEELEQKEIQSEEDAIEELNDLDLDDIDLE